MINKKIMVLALFLVSLLAISAVNATDNSTNDVVNIGYENEVINSPDTVLKVNDVDNDEVMNNEDILEIDDSQDKISLDNNDILSTNSPSYLEYSVSVSDTYINYENGGTIDVSIIPSTESYYNYDFYLEIVDSNNITKVSKNYYSYSSTSPISHPISSGQLNTGTYTIKIINFVDNAIMDTATLTVNSVSSDFDYPSYYDDDYDDYDYYYQEAVLKPTKLSTTYNSGKTFNVKVVSSKDESYALEDIEVKLRVYTKGSYKDYYAYTNYNGVAKFKVSKLSLGTHKVEVFSSDGYTTASKVSSTITIKSHPVKYVTIGKYKVKVWADDSLSVQKQKVLKFLKKKIKKPHTYKIKGFKFKVSAKTYIKILYNKKYKLGVVSFKIKTNKFKKVKVPIYKTKKVTKYKWKYKKVKVSMEDYYEWEYQYYIDGTVNGWSCYKLERTDFDYGVAHTHYVYLKKKVKYTATKKIVKGYKKVNVRVYALGHSSKWVPCVAFRAIGKGVNQFAGDGCYYRL